MNALITPTLPAEPPVLGFDSLESLGHEQVMLCQDADTGLRAIIAIHNTVLGPSLGGVRFWNYPSEADAFTDALRLSRGMTYKAAVAGLDLGGGKAVILGDPSRLKNEALLRRFGRFVENLGGKYITAEDVGVNERDMEQIARETTHVVGMPTERGGSGDPSPVTAYGVYMGMKAAQYFISGSDSLQGKRVMVNGVGKVGSYLVAELKKEGAKVYAYDVNRSALQNVVTTHGAEAVTEDQIFDTDAEIYAPCALGGGVNPDTIPQMRFSIIAGGANNQLLNERRDAALLAERGILYAPDFLINAGGLINVYTELEGYHRDRALRKAQGIYDATLQVLKAARDQGISTHEAAQREALARIRRIGSLQQYR